MATKPFAPVRGKVIRVTRLDACGNPDPGMSAVSVSKRISSVGLEELTEDSTDIVDRNFGDEICVEDRGFASILGYSAEIALCGVDPDMISIFTGQPVVRNAAGDVVGFDAMTNIDLDSFGFSVEIWSRLAGSACDVLGNRAWGYTVLPFLKGGRLGGFTIENAAVQFTITGAQTRNQNGWGVGPYDVDRDAGGLPAPLFTPLDPFAHYRATQVTLDPPLPVDGSFPLASA